MRTTLTMLALVVAVLWPEGARAATGSFANRELGLGVAAFGLVGQNDTAVTWGLPITLEGGFYIENGFSVFLHVPLMILQQKAPLGIAVATGGQLGLRYLFLEESIRPYVFVQLAGLYLFRDVPGLSNFYAGPGLGGGVDFFVLESISLGARLSADFFLTLQPGANAFQATISLGGGLYATTYF